MNPSTAAYEATLPLSPLSYNSLQTATICNVLVWLWTCTGAEKLLGEGSAKYLPKYKQIRTVQ